MNFPIRLILLFILVTHLSFGQYGTTEGLVLLIGEVTSEDEVSALSDVHLLNRNNGQVVITDPTGFFSIYISKIHVVRFTSVGYEQFYYSIPGDFKGEVMYQKIALKRKTTPLENVTIYGDREVTESILSVKKEPNPLEGVQFGTLVGEAHEVKPTAMNVASLLWDWWSREGKQKRKLKEILEQEQITSMVDSRFESDLIWELTGLYGTELAKFKRYCNLPPSYVLTANDYDFLVSVKRCYYTFKNQ